MLTLPKQMSTNKHKEEKEQFKSLKQWSLLVKDQMGMQFSLEAWR